MNHRKLITVVAIASVVVILFAGLEYFQFPFPPKTLSLKTINNFTGENWTMSEVSSSKTLWNSSEVRITSGWYASQKNSGGKSLSFQVWQCRNDSIPIDLQHTYYKFNGDLSLGNNMTQEGDVYYNYTVVYLNGGPFYSQITAYYKNSYIMFVTPPDGSGPILTKTIMVNVLNAQVQLLNESNPYFFNLLLT